MDYSFDHFPFFDSARELAARRATLAAFTPPPPLVIAPVAPAPNPGVPRQFSYTPPVAPAPATRFVKRGFSMVCCTCSYTIDFCPGHPAPDAPSADDRAGESLSRRIREARGGR